MKIVFMGTPDFAAMSLKKLIESKHEVALVVTKEDKPANRGYELQMTPVKKLALENNIEVITPSKVKGNLELEEKLKSIDADVFCVVAYGKILPKNILDIPKKGCINVHGSLLPKYRGSAPIQFAVINGDEKTGVTTMFMDEGVDTGDIIKVSEYNITDDDTAETVFDKLALMGGELLVDTLNDIENDNYTRTKQNEEEATHCGMLSKKDGEINFDMPTKKLFSFVRGMTPWPSAYTYLDGKMLKVIDLKKVLDDKTNAMPGTVINTSDDGVLVKTNDGAILITKLQLEGKKAMDASDFLRGRKIPDGTILGINE